MNDNDHISAAQALITMMSSKKKNKTAATAIATAASSPPTTSLKKKPQRQQRPPQAPQQVPPQQAPPAGETTMNRAKSLLFRDREGENQQDKLIDRNFLLDLFLIISDNQASHNSSIVTWLPSGKSFMIVNERKFVALIVPVLLGEGAGLQDFLLELIKWGFESTKPYGSSVSVSTVLFCHKFFKKGHQKLLRKIVPRGGTSTASVAMTTRKKKAISTSSAAGTACAGGATSAYRTTRGTNHKKKRANNSSSFSSSSLERGPKRVRVEDAAAAPGPVPPSILRKSTNEKMVKKNTASMTIGSAPIMTSSSSSLFAPSSCPGEESRQFLTEQDLLPLSLVEQFQQQEPLCSFAEMEGIRTPPPSDDFILLQERMKMERKLLLETQHQQELRSFEEQEMQARFENFMSNRRQLFFFQKKQPTLNDENEFLHGDKGLTLRTIPHPTNQAKKIVESALGILHRGKFINNNILE